MEMNATRTPTRRVEYKDWIVYKGNEYVREETLSLKSYSWVSEPDNLIDLHFIAWRSRDGNELVLIVFVFIAKKPNKSDGQVVFI